MADGALRLAGIGAKAPDYVGVQPFGEAVIDVACGIGNKKCAPLCFAKERVKLSLTTAIPPNSMWFFYLCVVIFILLLS